MSAFKTPLRFQDDGGLPFILIDPLIYESDLLKTTVVVPQYFKTDLASIPRGLWNLLPPIGRYDAAAVVHDLLYQHNGVTRAQADAVLNEAMGVLKVRGWQRALIYAGVRLGGGKIWDRYRKAESAHV